MGLESIPPRIFTIDTVITFLQVEKVVMDISKVIEHVAQSFIFPMVAYLILVGSHRISISCYWLTFKS